MLTISVFEPEKCINYLIFATFKPPYKLLLSHMMIQHTLQLENNLYSLDTMCSESDRLELLSLLVHVTVVPLREAVA